MRIDRARPEPKHRASPASAASIASSRCCSGNTRTAMLPLNF
jgi:hypothetical protein